ncbi:MAG: hypothetical protein A2X64_03190 [Ignavibacteria bacterium GWF2_33_9]|nr:MAG: hypothetical protein A2X64_03190 [Ignavibacteria bacterium GWF2_33_9]
MKKINYLLIVLILSIFSSKAEVIDSAYVYNHYSAVADKIIAKVMSDSSAWDRMAYMCDMFGTRFSGSESLNHSLQWSYNEMKKDGLANPTLEEVMVPNWKRGKEECELLFPKSKNIKISALGRSVATPENGIDAEVLVVKDFDDLDKNAIFAKGKIVVYNVKFLNYGQAVQYRFRGAIAAAKYGAVASLVRSVSPVSFDKLHTGVMGYDDTIPKIPHAAITHEDAMLMQRLQDRGVIPKLHLHLTCQTLEDTLSYNVYSELTGTAIPNEILALGGHSDSWDLSSGAHDDASGCIAGWQVLKVLKEMGIAPRRTLRSVFWVNEENGTRGGEKYAELHKNEPHVAVLEFDSGVFTPSAIGFNGDSTYFEILKGIEPLLKRIDKDMILRKGGGGVDIGPMMRLGITGMSLSTNDFADEYFWYHHGPADTPEKVDPMTFNKCIAAIAVATYIYADLPINVIEHEQIETK